MIVGSRLFVKLSVNGLWPRGSGIVPKMWKNVLVKGLSVFVSVGQRAFAHSFHALERSSEVWAAWWALLLVEGGANSPK